MNTSEKIGGFMLIAMLIIFIIWLFYQVKKRIEYNEWKRREREKLEEWKN